MVESGIFQGLDHQPQFLRMAVIADAPHPIGRYINNLFLLVGAFNVVKIKYDAVRIDQPKIFEIENGSIGFNKHR